MAFNPLGIFGNKMAQTATPTNMTDAEKLAQVMSGNLSGTLSGGDKLMALSALLKSVSRGSQTTPQQALAQIQQQKMNELQGKLQIEQMRRQAADQAQMDVNWNNLVTQTTDPKMRQYLVSLPASERGAVLRKLLEPTNPAEIKAPTTRTIFKGGEEVQEEFDPATRTWKEVGRGARWNPKGSGGVSLTVNTGPRGPEVVRLADGSIAVLNK